MSYSHLHSSINFIVKRNVSLIIFVELLLLLELLLAVPVRHDLCGPNNNMVVTPSSSLSNSSSPSRDSVLLLGSSGSSSPITSSSDILLYLRLYCNRLTHLATCRVLQLAFLAISVLLCLVIYTTVRSSTQSDETAFMDSDLTSSSSAALTGNNVSNKRKVVLFWTQWFDKPFSVVWPLGNEAFIKNCPKSDMYANCEFSIDRGRIKEADAVVFHIPDLVGKVSLFGGYDVPSYRSPNQRYIFFNQESPVHTLTRLSEFEDFFNWTMTYRRDSDVFAPYARFHPIEPTNDTSSLPHASSVNMLQNKTGWVAWVVSRCFTHSRREHYIADLRKHIPVDVWGRCGDSFCTGDCWNRISRNYRFYVSIENSLCTDYVTEKFFTRMEELDAILLVLQPHNASTTGRDNYANLAPRNSYIDASKFSSPEALAGFLRAVGSEPAMFSSFFQWRKNYTVKRDGFEQYCQLCRMLHDEKLPPKRYADIREWWVGGIKKNIDGSLASQPHCQAGYKYGSFGEASSPVFNVPYFIHITS